MNTVYKYTLRPNITLKMPQGATPLCVAEQNGEICLWVKVDIDNPMEQRSFCAIGTGHKLPCDMGFDTKYIGTAFLEKLVFHVFEII